MPTAVIRDCRGGWNSTDPVTALGENQVAAAINVTWEGTGLARKRRGCAAETTTGLPAGQALVHLSRYTPFGDARLERVMALTDEGQCWVRYPGAFGPSWASVTVNDVFNVATLRQTVGVSFNGKWFIAGDTYQNRLHVWDGSGALRRTGIDGPYAAPAVSDYPLAGGYPVTTVYYKVAWATLSGTTVLRRSELSPAATLTPSGTSAGVLIAHPLVLPGDGETHWEVYGSTDDAYYYRLQTLDLGTASWSHGVELLPTQFTDYPLADTVGSYQLLPSGRTLLVDENRLLMAGCYEDDSLASRVWWTPILGSEAVGDDERYVNTTTQKNYLDLDALERGGIVALAHLNNSVLVFKTGALYKLVRTGQVEAPYVPVTITKTTGAVSQQTVVEGEDGAGNAAVYWLDTRGPMRYGPNGVEYLGEPLEGWLATASANWSGSAHGLYYPKRRQVWWWVSEAGAYTLSGSTPIYTNDTVLVYDVRTGGWAQYTGALGTATASVAAPSNGAMVLDLAPLAALDDTPTLVRGDSGTDDNGTAFEASLTTRAFQPLPGQNLGITEVQVVAEAGGDVSVTLTADCGLDVRTVQVNLDAQSGETLVARKVEGLENTSAQWVQVTVGDEAATDTAWAVHQVTLAYRPEEAR